MAQAEFNDHHDQCAVVFNEKKKSEHKSFKFNVAAPAFVPSTLVAQTEAQTVPLTGFYYPCFQYVDGTAAGSWIYVANQESAIPLIQPKVSSNANLVAVEVQQQQQQQQQKQQNNVKENVVSDELRQKIIKQAEYMFSDMSMLANESFAKHVCKDPEGYVPINFISTTKKLKSLNVNNQMAAQALRSSSKLTVSSDGKKVKRKQPFTEREKEDLQLRTVIAENLPDDHSHQNIEKIFNVAGSIRAIRICQPQENSSRSSKGDIVVSNKLHALVEYENPEAADRAAEKLNDERNWRKGMRVRVMLKRSPKSVLKGRKSDFDGCFDDDEGPALQLHEDTPQLSSLETSESDENSSALKKSWTRNRTKPKLRSQLQTARSLPTPSSRASCIFPGDISARQTVKGPRMPDGTRGFTMGRGKPLSIPVHSS